MLFKLSKNLIPQWVGDLGIHAGVPDIPMSQVIDYVLDTSPSFKQVYSDRMSKRVDVAGVESSLVCIRAKEIRSYWIPGSYAPTLSKNRNAFRSISRSL